MPSRRLLVRPFTLLTSQGRRLPDLSWVTPSLSISGTLQPRHFPELARLGIAAVVDLREERRDDEALLAKQGIRLLHLPARDHWPPSQTQLLQGSQWVMQQAKEGRKILIHCKEGVGRSVVLACCVLMLQGYDLASALALVKACRWGAHPRKRQRESLQQFAELTASSDPPSHTGQSSP